MKYYLSLITLTFFIINPFVLTAQSIINTTTIEGVWQVVDSKGDALYYVEIYKENELYYGKLTKLFTSDNPQEEQCTACTDKLKNKPIIGLPILTKMERGQTKYSKGRILDYKKGKQSPCTIWMNSENVIKVRSWWLFLYNTHTWYRIS